MMNVSVIRDLIRDIPDFPKKGVIFRDITPVLKDAKAFHSVITDLANELKTKPVDYLIGIESRGFIFSPAIAYQLDVGFIPVRKKGKLPYQTEKIAYDLEYGQAILEIHQDALGKGARVAVVDDLLATGGTALATVRLVEKLGGKVEKIAFFVELLFLKGREKLAPYDVVSLVQYS